VSNIILTGFSGTGKSLVAKEVAQRLNWNFIDIDDEIVKLAGKPIAEIFQPDGEKRFRELERQMLEKACQGGQSVIAIGGGAIVDHQNYELLAKSGLIICLEARPETIYQRLFPEITCESGPEARPLLADDNPLERITQLKASRQPYYAKSDWTIHTDNLSISEVAEEVVRGWRLLRRFAPRNDKERAHNHKRKAFSLSPSSSPFKGEELKPGNEIDKDIACEVKTATESYPVFVGWGLLGKLGDKMKQAGLSGTVTIISDTDVFSIYGQRVGSVLQNAGLVVNSLVVPPGETSKSIDSATKVYDFLVEHRVERHDILVALGGGMVGDLAGFVAATFLRGIPWIQVPTSLVAMVDASIGGKVAVNHPQGKNLIGAFYQPSFVLADVQTLTSLPQRELSSGWAEVIKHGLILDKGYFGFLEANVDKLIKLEPNITAQAIARSAAIKAQVVSEDEKERGRRTILNYGHTIAHGLEAATRYSRFLHGEAVSIGMMGAAKLSQRLNLLPMGMVERQQALLGRFGLPISFSKLDLAEVTRAMELDKKMRGKAIRWVLLSGIGEAIIRSDVPQHEVEAVLQELSQS
jgi:3-dehydroquinate synthase